MKWKVSLITNPQEYLQSVVFYGEISLVIFAMVSWIDKIIVSCLTLERKVYESAKTMQNGPPRVQALLYFNWLDTYVMVVLDIPGFAVSNSY